MKLFIIILFFSTSISFYASCSWNHKANFRKKLGKKLRGAFELERGMHSYGYSDEQTVATLTSLSLHEKIMEMKQKNPTFKWLFDQEVLRTNSAFQ